MKVVIEMLAAPAMLGKTFASAYAAYLARRASDYGLTIGGPVEVNMQTVKARKDAIARCHDPGLKHDDLTVPVGNSRAACATYGGSKDLMIRKFAYGHAAPQAAQAVEPTGPTRVHEAVSGRPHAAPRLH
jgi:hypothetical protein